MLTLESDSSKLPLQRSKRQSLTVAHPNTFVHNVKDICLAQRLADKVITASLSGNSLLLIAGVDVFVDDSGDLNFTKNLGECDRQF
jgi:hypothetical protein